MIRVQKIKNRKKAAWLALSSGAIGGHKFYLGENRQGMLRLLFCWTLIPLFLAVVDFFRLLVMKEQVFNEIYNKDSANNTFKQQAIRHGIKKGIIEGVKKVLFG